MLFGQRFHAGLASGEITLTVRRWRRPHVKVGGSYRTAAGLLVVDAVERVPLSAVTDEDARRAGFGGRAELAAFLRAEEEEEVYRVVFHHGGPVQPDPLPLDDDLSADDVAAISTRLAAMDTRGRDGAWTAATLDLIARRPETRAADLATELGRERLPFKADVRKLKRLGLTESLDVGYRLSPRGRAYVRAAGPATPPARPGRAANVPEHPGGFRR